MKLPLSYKAHTLSADLSWANFLGILEPALSAVLPDIQTTLINGLEHPIGMKDTLQQQFHAGDSVCIVVSDASRKTGMEQVLPHLVDWLVNAGIREQDITFLIATGAHRPATTEEECRILGATLFERFHDRIYNHDAFDADNLVQVGITGRGTEVRINRHAYECDRLILTGAAMPHYFAGFGGGRKALVPGLAGAATIARNHVRSLHPTEARLHPQVHICTLDGNPVAEDLLEAALLHPPAFIVNTVLGRDGAIVDLFVGEMDAAHRSACALARDIYTVSIKGKADLVIAVNNTAPNFIQCHKALFNAYHAMKPGGRILLLAPLTEGLGSGNFRHYLEMGDSEAVAALLRQTPDINGQTALSTLEKAAHAVLVTELDKTEVHLLGAQKAASLDEALQHIRQYFEASGNSTPSCYVMPNAGSTVPLSQPE